MTALDSSSLKFWELVGEWGFVFVIVGVAGEGVEIFIKLFLPKLYDRKKFCLDIVGGIFWMVLVVALAVEFWGNHKAMRIADAENARLHDRASANELKVAELSSNNLVLQTNVNETKTELANAEARLIEVQNENLPMDIGEQLTFGAALKKVPGMQIILLNIEDIKAEKTAEDFRTAFIVAGWNVVRGNQVENFENKGISIATGFNPDPLTDEAANFLLQLLTDREVPAMIVDANKISIMLGGIPTNTIVVVVGERPSTIESKIMEFQAKGNWEQAGKLESQMDEEIASKTIPGLTNRPPLIMHGGRINSFPRIK